jgi:thymidylate synthase (FAD)
MIKVLDHGFARLVSYMQPAERSMGVPDWPNDADVGYTDDWTGDLEIVRNARASYDADWRTGDDDKDAKLVNYLTKNRHTSPFEAMAFTFEIKAPIFVMRQWHRHRTWSYNEVSARYAELPEEFYVPAVEQITTQSTSNKQMRTTEPHSQAENIEFLMRDHCKLAFNLYRNMLAAGVPRELARGVLPLNTYTRMFATVDLHNLFHFLTLRLHEHAQYEIRVYAEALLELISPICPVAVAAFKEHRL